MGHSVCSLQLGYCTQITGKAYSQALSGQYSHLFLLWVWSKPIQLVNRLKTFWGEVVLTGIWGQVRSIFQHNADWDSKTRSVRFNGINEKGHHFCTEYQYPNPSPEEPLPKSPKILISWIYVIRRHAPTGFLFPIKNKCGCNTQTQPIIKFPATPLCTSSVISWSPIVYFRSRYNAAYADRCILWLSLISPADVGEG